MTVHIAFYRTRSGSAHFQLIYANNSIKKELKVSWINSGSVHLLINMIKWRKRLAAKTKSRIDLSRSNGFIYQL